MLHTYNLCYKIEVLWTFCPQRQCHGKVCCTWGPLTVQEKEPRQRNVDDLMDNAKKYDSEGQRRGKTLTYWEWTKRQRWQKMFPALFSGFILDGNFAQQDSHCMIVYNWRCHRFRWRRLPQREEFIQLELMWQTDFSLNSPFIDAIRSVSSALHLCFVLFRGECVGKSWVWSSLWASLSLADSSLIYMYPPLTEIIS